jgi:dolichyl-phosphate beta-glucosyltransferase
VAGTAEPFVSLVIPAYNEERRLGDTLAAWHDFFHRQPYPFELLVVDDGSRDGTAALVERAAVESQPTVRLIRLPGNRGKGAAVKVGMLQAAGRYAFFVDADLNIAPPHLARALDLFHQRHCDLVIGSRRLGQYADQERSLGRLAAGGLVQLVRRALVLPVIRDTQCGFKGFRRDAARAIFEKTRVLSFAFDIEALFLARKLGYSIVEMPVTTTYRADSTFDVTKHLRPLLRDIVQIRRNEARGYYGR